LVQPKPQRPEQPQLRTHRHASPPHIPRILGNLRLEQHHVQQRFAGNGIWHLAGVGWNLLLGRWADKQEGHAKQTESNVAPRKSEE
jgi:hypothetical protein